MASALFRMKTAINQLCDLVRETSFGIHRYHRHGHLEKIYENALVHRLRKQGLDVKQQHPVPVYDEDGFLLGDFFADVVVENQLIVELKAVKATSTWPNCSDIFDRRGSRRVC